jgi:hypothetical protein
MNFEKLIKTVSEILENENIEKHGLILTYELHPKAYLSMNLEVYQKINETSVGFSPIKFVKKEYTN